jgi:hypothetical protein
MSAASVATRANHAAATGRGAKAASVDTFTLSGNVSAKLKFDAKAGCKVAGGFVLSNVNLALSPSGTVAISPSYLDLGLLANGTTRFPVKVPEPEVELFYGPQSTSTYSYEWSASQYSGGSGSVTVSAKGADGTINATLVAVKGTKAKKSEHISGSWSCPKG